MTNHQTTTEARVEELERALFPERWAEQERAAAAAERAAVAARIAAFADQRAQIALDWLALLPRVRQAAAAFEAVYAELAALAARDVALYREQCLTTPGRYDNIEATVLAVPDDSPVARLDELERDARRRGAADRASRIVR
jgi:hypothetical protein